MKKIDLGNPGTKRIVLISIVVIFILFSIFLLFNLLKPESTQILPKSPVVQTQKSSLAPVTYTKLIPIKEEVSSATTEATQNNKQSPTPTPQIDQPTPTSAEETILAQDSGSSVEKGGETILDTSTSPTPEASDAVTTQPPVTGYIQNTLLIGGISLVVIILAFVF